MHERRRHTRWSGAALYAGALGLFVCLGLVSLNAQQPDFTGVWTNYVEPGQGRGGGAATAGGGRGGAADLPMTAEGRQKVQAYQALIKGTGDTPGGFCLGTGMPGSMLGSGGYPMEIIQRPNQITIIYEAHNEVRRVYLGDRIVPEADRRCRPWGFGWRMNWPAHGAWFGDLLPADAYGHWGATGTLLWIAPSLDAFAVILTTQPQDPDGRFVARLSNAIVASLL